MRRSVLLLSGLLLCLTAIALALPVSADPDPPPVDGGNVTLDRDWTVDPGDHLVYVNQTIKVNGNVTVSPTGVLELVNCTLYLNGTHPSEWPRGGLRVGTQGTLNVTSGSVVRALFLDYFWVDPGAHVLIEDSTVEHIGHTAPLEMSGLYSQADDTVIRRSTIRGGNHGLILDGVTGCTVEDVHLVGPQRKGVYLLGGTSSVTLRDLSMVGHMESISLLDCHDITVSNVSISGSSFGIGLDNGTMTLVNAWVRDVTGGVVQAWGPGGVQWVVDGDSGLVNCTLRLNGSLEVLSGGSFTMVNSTLEVDNPTAHGVNGIAVRSGGGMAVTGGSIVTHVDGGFNYTWLVETGGQLTMDGARVEDAGWDAAFPGLVLASSGNPINGTTFADCYAGVTVTGDGNAVTNATFDGCRIGVRVTGSDALLSDLAFGNGTRTCLAIEGARDLRLVGMRLTGPPVHEAINATASQGLHLQDIDLESSVSYGLQLTYVANVRVVGLDLTASVRCLNVHQGPYARSSNVTVEDGRFQGPFPVQVVDVDGLVLRNLTVSGGVGGVVSLEGVDDLAMLSCQLGTGRDVNLRQVSDATVDGCHLLAPMVISDSEGVVLVDCFVQSVALGIYGDNVTGLGIRGLSLLDVTDGTFLANCSNASVDDSVFTNVLGSGLSFVEVFGALVVNVSVVSADVGVNITGGANCTLRELGLFGVREGVRVTGLGVGHSLEDSVLASVPAAVTVGAGCRLAIVRCSFYDCALAVDGHRDGEVQLLTDGASEIVNSTCRLRGWFVVTGTGELNITATSIEFMGDNATDSGIDARAGSTLRVTQGSWLEGRGGTFSVLARGGLVLRASTVVGGGAPGGPAAVASRGPAAVIVNVTFSDCGLALSLNGSDPTVSGCVFSRNRQSVLLDGVTRLRMIGCSFSLSNTSWDIQGNFTSSLQITDCTFEGGGTVPMAMWLEPAEDDDSVLSLRNVTVSNYTLWGLQDDHHGNVLMSGCTLFSANAQLGRRSGDKATLDDLHVEGCSLVVGSSGLTLTDCTFTNASLKVQNNSGGSLVSRCSFSGSPGEGTPSLDVDGSLRITLRELDLSGVGVGLRISGRSDVTVDDLSLDGASGTAMEVDGSIVRLEGCHLRGLGGTGVRVWNVGSRVEFRNGTISATPGRSGHDVDASNGGDAWLLNTTFDHSSVLSSGAGRVEVLWHVTVEPVMPWGAVLQDPDYLSVVDASGTEVVNVSTTGNVLRLLEFSEVNGARTPLTPHTFNVADQVEGVTFRGDFTINASKHLVLDLDDVAAPVARAGPDQVVDEDEKVTLNGSGSSDNDPTSPGTGSFRWTFDEYGNQVVLDGELVSYVFSVPGKYWVNLTVWDAAGNTGADTVIIQVRDRTPPVVLFGGNRTVDEDAWSILDASATTDNDPTFDFTTGTFLWRIDLGTVDLERDTATFGHAFPEPGNFTGTLSVWDKAGNLALRTFWVTVLDITPPVILGISNATVFEPTDGLLDASVCQDNVAIVSYQWSVTFHNWSGGPDGHDLLEGVTPDYTFDRLGSYTVTLTLEDAAGNVNATDIGVVYDDPPVISLPAWAVSMAGERLEVPVTVSDVYFTDLRVTFVDGDDGPAIEGSPPGTLMVWRPGDDVAGEDVAITLEVHDGFVSSQATIIVHVNPARGAGNSPPTIRSRPPVSSKRDTPYLYFVDAVDPDGDVLGFQLLEGPGGMTVSQGGTVSWDPPFSQGTELVDVRLMVTDGRDPAEQAWTIRWREPPNVAPLITFTVDPVEVRLREGFSVDLSIYIQDMQAYDLDADDPNYLITWDVSYDEAMVTLTSREGLLFRFQARDVKGAGTVNFTATDPSGATGTTQMDLVVRGLDGPPPDEGTGWLLWVALAALVAVGVAGGAMASSRRRRRSGSWGPGPSEERELELGPPPEEEAATAAALEAALASEGVPGEVGAFVELEGRGPRAGVRGPVEEIAPAPVVSRVLDDPAGPSGRTFSVEGAAVLEANGKVLASTGRVEEVIGAYGDALEEVRRGLRGDGLAVLEMEGRRVLMALRSGLGALCVVRGKEDEAFRSGLRDQLGSLFQDRSAEGAVGVLDDVLAAAGPGGTAEVVHDAWTTRLDTELTYQGSVVLLDTRLRNDTESILNNVRLRLHHDADALSIQSITPKLLASHGRMSLGNVPPGKEHKVAISFMPEVCMSSSLRVLVTYTDMEGRTVHVPSPTMAVQVECPHIEAGGEVDDERILAMSERGLGHGGRRVFDHGIDVDHLRLYRLAVDLVGRKGPMKVIDLEDTSLMRAESWFLGSGQGGTPQVLVRVSSHGADHLLEVYVTSDDGAVATGLLTHLAVEVLDAAASEMPGKRVERVRDSATLEEMAVWPSLLDYKVMGD